MNSYAYFSLVSSLTSAFLGVIVFSISKKRVVNKLFLLTALAGFWWTFTEFMMWQASNAEIAYFWNKMGFMWPFFTVLVLHFSLVYTESNWLKNKFTYLLLYLPAAVFAFIDLTTEMINGAPVLQYWGYEDVSPATWAYGVSTVWTAVLPVLAFSLCLIFYRKTADEYKKQQSKLVTAGFGVPIFTYIVTNILFPFFEINIPNLGHMSILFFGSLVGYAILKHELFTFDAAMAAENIISTMPDSLVLADIDGRMRRVNKRLSQFFGYKEKDLMGRSITKLFVTNNSWVVAWKELTEKRTIRNYELTCKTKRGEEKTVLFSGSVVQSKTGRDIGITCVMHDITERNQIEERLVKTERLASIGELAGQIGHDLRNPLTGIKSGVYFLRKKGNKITDEKRDAVLGMMDNAIEDSNRIISSLLDYSGNLCLEKFTCTPQSLLQSALRKVQVPERIKLIDKTTDKVELSVDVPKMERVFASIIQNAVDAIPESGSIEIRSTAMESNVEIVVSDTGTGIPETIREKIFSPLITTKAKGMGMSLSICKRIIDAHSGEITVKCTSNKGTTLTITLPIEPKNEFIVSRVDLVNVGTSVFR